MNKIWYKRRIFRRIFQLILTIKKTLKTFNLPWNLWLFTLSSPFSIKKRLFSNVKRRIVELPKVNKTIIKQNKVWTQTNDQFKRQNATIPTTWLLYQLPAQDGFFLGLWKVHHILDSVFLVTNFKDFTGQFLFSYCKNKSTILFLATLSSVFC